MLTRTQLWSPMRVRGPVTWACLFLFAVGSVGFPLPQPLAIQKEAGEPFPCQDRACGCHTAEQCRRHCCCFSAAEKQAWFAARRSGQRPLDNFATGRATRSRGCCKSNTDSLSECHREEEGGSWLCQISAQKCQGLTSLWGMIGLALPIECEAPILMALESAFILPGDEFGISLCSPPPIPPPRIS